MKGGLSGVEGKHFGALIICFTLTYTARTKLLTPTYLWQRGVAMVGPPTGLVAVLPFDLTFFSIFLIMIFFFFFFKIKSMKKAHQVHWRSVAYVLTLIRSRKLSSWFHPSIQRYACGVDMSLYCLNQDISSQIFFYHVVNRFFWALISRGIYWIQENFGIICYES